jgi:DNA-binding transcriptional ArsR family regulator
MERQTKVHTSPPSERSEISVEAIFDVLSSPYRRYVLSYLSDATTPTTIGDLAYHLAAWEEDTNIDEVSDEEATEAEILLYHVHLPKLTTVGLVTYDAESGAVAPEESIGLATDCIPAGE